MATVCKMRLVGAVLALPERQMGAASGTLTRFLAGLRPDNYTHILDEGRRGRHRPASAEAMQKGYHCCNPHLQMGDLGQPDTLLSHLQMRLPGWKGGASPASLATRLKSGVMIMRAIYITALKRGESGKPTLQNMRTIIRSETTPYTAIAGMCEPQLRGGRL